MERSEPVTGPRDAADALGAIELSAVAAAVAALSADAGEDALRAQLSAASDVIANAQAFGEPPGERGGLLAAAEDALTAKDLDAAIETAATLASFDRGRVKRVDWTAASGS